MSHTAVEEEVGRLRGAAGVGFHYESHEVVGGILRAIGTIAHVHEHGGIDSMRVRLEYPYHHGKTLRMIEKYVVVDLRHTDTIAVFDHDKVFAPSAEGHLFNNHQLCLEFPFRDELSRDPARAVEEVLGAATLWLLKRSIFERSNHQWPGDTEDHDYSGPSRAVALRAARLSGADLEPWAMLSIDASIRPQFAKACPCSSGRTLVNCHLRVGQLVTLAIIYRRRES